MKNPFTNDHADPADAPVGEVSRKNRETVREVTL